MGGELSSLYHPPPQSLLCPHFRQSHSHLERQMWPPCRWYLNLYFCHWIQILLQLSLPPCLKPTFIWVSHCYLKVVVFKNESSSLFSVCSQEPMSTLGVLHHIGLFWPLMLSYFPITQSGLTWLPKYYYNFLFRCTLQNTRNQFKVLLSHVYYLFLS